MTKRSRGIVLALGLAGLVIEAVVAHPALATDKVKLFKVVTQRDVIVIGLTPGQLEKINGTDAGAVATALNKRGALKVWQYSPRRSPNGELEQRPVRQVGLLAGATVRVERYTTAMRVVPITEIKMQAGPPEGLKQVPKLGSKLGTQRVASQSAS